MNNRPRSNCCSEYFENKKLRRITSIFENITLKFHFRFRRNWYSRSRRTQWKHFSNKTRTRAKWNDRNMFIRVLDLARPQCFFPNAFWLRSLRHGYNIQKLESACGEDFFEFWSMWFSHKTHTYQMIFFSFVIKGQREFLRYKNVFSSLWSREWGQRKKVVNLRRETLWPRWCILAIHNSNHLMRLFREVEMHLNY